MKHLIILLIISLSVVSYSNGQAPDPVEIPFKKAKKIILLCDTAVNDLYKQFGKFLGQNGYSIETSNADFETLTTGPHDTSKLNYSYKIIASVDGSKITLSMQWRLNSSWLAGTQETSLYDWEFANDKNGNALGIMYNDVMAVVKSFQPVQKILYSL